MGSEIQLVGNGDGIAVIGQASDVERFLTSERLPSSDLGLQRVGPLLAAGAATAAVGSELAANSGRWVKLTAESAEAVRKYGLMPTKTAGVSHAMIGQPGDIKQWLQIAQAPGALLTGPMALVTLSTMMSQAAMQQQMDEIAEYLVQIDEKIDDILRAQKDAILADMIGVDLVIEEAMTVRENVGRVSEVTWSKVQFTSMAIARTQGYALRQLDALAEKLEKKADLGEVAKATRAAEPKVKEWLALLARSFQLQDGIAVLELDRVLDLAPDELDRHRQGLSLARKNRIELIARSTARLLDRMDEAVKLANTKVLLNPFDSPAVVRSSTQVAVGVLELRDRLGIDSDHQSAEARRWGRAASELRDKVLASAAERARATKRFGEETADRASQPFRSVDIDGDGVPDRARAITAAQHARASVQNVASGAGDKIGRLFSHRRQDEALTGEDVDG